MTLVDRLETLARLKHIEFAARPELTACALTGSLPRGRVWPGSDLDFHAYWAQEDDEFEDGVEDGIYWEIDIDSLEALEVDADDLIEAPPFSNEQFGDTILEVLWGARVLFDRDGRLEQAVAEVKRLSDDREWLRERAANYLRYGLECLDELADADPQQAILDARRIAIVYGVNAYWNRRGELFSSAIRIPERLGDHPEIQNLFRGIWNLDGQRGWDTFYAKYQTMPAEIREEADPDVLREILPAVQLGIADGGLCHFRFIAEGWLPLDVVAPLLGFEADLAAQKARVLDQTRAMLHSISRF